MICGAVNRIFFQQAILSLIELLTNNQKQRQECLTSDNDNSTIDDLHKKT